ncbi:putative cyclophilin 15 [Trypanosoma cruzi]|uniref:Putative cyclophilin 15 n=1 Tax=Trypanosoma cruzi TaxID=5693 RepID=A0A2V2WJH4_TRYCR|nr:putative cyclophilin 15 [Trypanosoma cruzi]
MQATLHFRFPNRQNPKEPRDVSVRVLLQAAEQRPKATLNFFFMCTGQLPSTDVLNSLGIAVGELSATSVGGGLRSSGLKPFAESTVVRIEKNVMMEIGSSMTKTIFGGFIEDEPLEGKQSHPSSSSSISTAARSTHAAGMQQLRAGTILIGNVGSPNTNGSRYYFLLQDVVTGKTASRVRCLSAPWNGRRRVTGSLRGVWIGRSPATHTCAPASRADMGV